jgi:hypothetical protein
VRIPGQALAQVRPLKTFAWRTYNADRKPLPVLPPHREFTTAHLAVLSEPHRHTLNELWLDLTRTTLHTRDIQAFLATLLNVKRLVLFLPPDCLSLLAVLASSDDSFLPSLKRLTVAIRCYDQYIFERDSVLQLPHSRFAAKLRELQLYLVIDDLDLDCEEAEQRLHCWLYEGPAGAAFAAQSRRLKRPSGWCFIAVEPWDDWKQVEFQVEGESPIWSPR